MAKQIDWKQRHDELQGKYKQLERQLDYERAKNDRRCEKGIDLQEKLKELIITILDQ